MFVDLVSSANVFCTYDSLTHTVNVLPIEADNPADPVDKLDMFEAVNLVLMNNCRLMIDSRVICQININ